MPNKKRINKCIKLLILTLALLIFVCGCSKDNKEDAITEHRIIYGKYTSYVEGFFDKKINEDLELTFINKNGEYITDTIYHIHHISFGEENKVICTNEGSFWETKEYILTQEAYNKIVSNSPMIVNLESTEVE